jgi:hypothetical protein
MIIRIRSEFAGILHENLKRLLVPPSSLPLHEIFTFSATAAVRRHLVGKYVTCAGYKLDPDPPD